MARKSNFNLSAVKSQYLEAQESYTSAKQTLLQISKTLLTNVTQLHVNSVNLPNKILQDIQEQLNTIAVTVSKFQFTDLYKQEEILQQLLKQIEANVLNTVSYTDSFVSEVSTSLRKQINLLLGV